MSNTTVSKIDPALLKQLRPVVRRERWRRVIAFLAIAWVALAFIALLILAINRSAQSALDPFVPDAWMWICGFGVVGTLVALVSALLSTPGVETISHRVEEQFPELDSVLLTAIEQQPQGTEGFSFFQHDVIQRAVHHSFQKKWSSVVPIRKLISSSFGATVGLSGLIAAGLYLFFMSPPETDNSIHLFSDTEQPAKPNLTCAVQPGNTEVERGTNLLVLAEFTDDTPPKAELQIARESGQNRVLSMTKSLDDPVFATRIMQVNEPLTYRVEFSDQSTAEYRVTVFDYPRLLRTDVELDYPSFANLPKKTLQDTQRFSAVIGTEAKLQFHINKNVTTAILRPTSETGEAIELLQNETNSLLWETDIVVEQSEKYHLHLVDNEGRENKSPPRLSIKAISNKPPELKLLEPARDIAVSALEEVFMSASVRDDFGVLRTGLAWSIGGGDTRELELASNKSGKKKHVVDHLLELESLNAEPDQLVSWHFWAEDVGPDGESRRTESDMFFAEVRRFEEIFYQAQGGQNQQQGQQQGQGGASAQQAMELAELQKEITNATWRVIRREKGPALTRAFSTDVDVLIESQQSAIEQVDELAEQLNDELAKTFVDELKSFMNESVDKLQTAKNESSAKPLSQAIRAQQSAWQTLLKMRARESQVQKSQQQQSQSQSAAQASRQRQLQQMELTEQEDRYEQERQAQEESEEAQQQRENRQILSRLRELAQRQKDLNKRIRELQSALEEAESEEEEEDLRQQLKRLEEEQQQLLRDTDELQERMEESQSQQTDQMEQLQEARENIQRSSEALKQGELSQASTEGTRAERELKELRDEFQKQTSGQFNEQMRQMRNQARDLQQEQEELAQKLQDVDSAERKENRLDGDSKRETLTEGLRKGQKEVEELREQIKETIEEAEEFEPLLADELYDTYRESEKSRPDRALEYSAQAIERGFDDDAEQIHEIARKGIDELREGIDRAAERVLGDETEALKAARDTIKRLSSELENEIERNDADAANETGEERRANSESNSDSKPESNEKQEPGAESESSGEQPQGGNGQRQDEEQQQSSNEQNQNGSGQPEQNEDAKPQQGQGQGNGQNPDAENGEQAQPGGNEESQNRRGGNRLDGEPGQQRQLGGITGPTNNRNFAPIAGDDFRDWADRLRDVEEMIADPDLRADAARIRDKAKAIRKDLKRHSPEPDWKKIKLELAEPLAELRNRVTQEILRRDPKNSLVPLTKEPVPVRYQNAVQKYYEKLGTGQ